MPTSLQRDSKLSHLLMFLSLSILCCGVVICVAPRVFPSAYDAWVAEIIRGLRARDSATSEQARKFLEAFPNDALGLALYAESAIQQGEHQLAIELFKQLQASGERRWELRAAIGLGRRYQQQGRLGQAEKHLKRAIELAPNRVEATDLLSYLLQLEGRTAESFPHYFQLVRSGKCGGDELLGVAAPERFFVQDQRLETLCPELKPLEIMINMPLGRQALFDNRNFRAERLLRDLLAVLPELGEAQGRLGRIIVDRGNTTEFLQWLAQIPTEAREHPQVWFAQGVQARRLGQTEGAVSCFLNTLAVMPNHVPANVQVSNCLERLGQTEAATEFARRAELLSELESNLSVLRTSTDPELIVKSVKLLGKLGRYWEAAGWCHTMQVSLYNPPPGNREQLRHWLKLARAESGPNAPSMLPARLLKSRKFAAPHWPLPGAAGAEENPAAADAKPPTQWMLVDDAARLGIDFEYYEGTTEASRMEHIFNTMGGGLAALDYDNDGWQDLYLAQANNWHDPKPQSEYIDRLFRNQLGERFQDVTALANLREIDFSHGVNVGDYNQDGFADIYVGNKGPNRLYCGNGDGTFDDVTAESGTAGNEWTTSSVFADFTGDGLPDLFVLNYSKLKETAEKLCKDPAGKVMACTPDLLIAEADRCYVNNGDGTFRDISHQSGIDLPTGKGLGVIVWDFAGDGNLGIFVANDTSPNFLFTRTGMSAEGDPQFREEALVRGIGVDADGNAQASMGVGASDVNHDGRLDLFVTTFYGESKTLFVQREGGFFEDLSRLFDLRNPGFFMLGFGCQFLDLNGDGWEDILTTNGHVDQRSASNSDRMPPQVFLNRNGRRFLEVPRADLGPYFQGSYLGRGLAKLDWNRDGRLDAGISQLHGKFALLTNQTPSDRIPLGIKLLGRKGCREALGATVWVTFKDAAGDHKQVRLLSGGDGFLVTNEHLLQFSIPAQQPAVQIEVQWPGGAKERWENIKAGQEVLIMEGVKVPFVMRQYN